MSAAPTSQLGALAAPFPWFGGKSGACDVVWQAFGDVQNYVEPFEGSAAMLLGAPDCKRIETINDADGFVANFWRAIHADPEAVAHHADWPCNEVDLFARHSWLVRHAQELTDKLHADPQYFDAKMAGWWCWGACNWIGSGWCTGDGPWVLGDDGKFAKKTDSGGVRDKLPHLSAGRGINRQLPHLGETPAPWRCRAGHQPPNRWRAQRLHSCLVCRPARSFARCAGDVRRLVAGCKGFGDGSAWPDGRVFGPAVFQRRDGLRSGRRGHQLASRGAGVVRGQWGQPQAAHCDLRSCRGA